MKKQTKIIVAILTVALLLGTLVFAAFAETPAEASINGTKYATFTEAIDAVKDGETIKLENDITIVDGYIVSKAVSIDLNGFTIDGATNHTAGKHLFDVDKEGKLSITGKGKIIADNCSVIFIYQGKPNASAEIKASAPGSIEIVRGANGAQALVDIRDGVVTLDGVKVVTDEMYNKSVFTVGTIKDNVGYGGTFNFKNSTLRVLSENINGASYSFSQYGKSTVNVDNSEILLKRVGFTAKGVDKELCTLNITNSIVRSDLFKDNGKEGYSVLFNPGPNALVNITGSTIASSYRVFAIDGDKEINCTINTKDSYLASGVKTNSLIFRGYADITVDNCKIYNPVDFVWKTVSKTTNGQGLVIKNGTSFYKMPPKVDTNHGYNLEEGMAFIKCGEDGFQYKLAPVGTKENPYDVVYDDDFRFGLNFGMTPAKFGPDGKQTAGAGKNGVDRYPNIVLGGNIKDGVIGVAGNNSGNFYLKFGFVEDKHGVDPFGGISVGKGYALDKYDYFTFDVDVSTDDKFINELQMFVCARTTGSKQTQKDTNILFKVDKATNEVYINDSHGKEVYRFANVPFNWQHITFVIKMDPDHTKSLIKIFVNGTEIVSATCFKEHTEYIDILRFAVAGSVQSKAGENFIWDKINIRAFDKGYTGDLEALMNGTKKLVDCKESKYTNNYEFPLGETVATVNGKKFDTIDKAVQFAVVNGGTIHLIGDVNEEYFVADPFVIDTHGFKFNTNSDYYYYTEEGTVRTYIYDEAGEFASEVTWFNKDGESDFSVHPFGSPIRFPADAYIEVVPSYTEGGKYYEFVGWTSTEGGEAEPEYISSELTTSLVLYPVYKAVDLAFTGTVDGKPVMSTEITDILNYNNAKDVRINLQSDIVVNGKFEISLNNPINFTLDFNGHSMIVGEKGNLFKIYGNDIVVNVISSLPGGSFANVSTKEGNGGALIQSSNTSKESTANIGSFLGADGNNFSFNGSCLADVQYTKVNIVDGNYYRRVADYSGFIIARASATYNCKNANFINTWNTYNYINNSGVNSTFNFDNCKFISKTNTKMFGKVGAGTKVTFNNTLFNNVEFNAMDGVTFGEGCQADRYIKSADASLVTYLTNTTDKLAIRHLDYGPEYDFHFVDAALETKALYTIGKTAPVVDKTAGLMQNLTLYADFNLNLYVPVAANLKGIYTVHGAENLLATAPKVTFGGVEYYVLTKGVDATGVASNVEFYLEHENGFEVVTLNIASYADKILAGEYSNEVKNLMKAMLTYANEAEKALNGAENATAVELLKKYGAVELATEFGEKFDVAALAEVLVSAQLKLDSTPDFVFTVQKTFTGKITVTLGDKVVTADVVAGDVEAVVVLDDVRLYAIDGTITIKAVGTVGEKAVDVTGNYNLATYIAGLAAEDVNANFAKALYTYAQYAKAYKAFLAK